MLEQPVGGRADAGGGNRWAKEVEEDDLGFDTARRRQFPPLQQDRLPFACRRQRILLLVLRDTRVRLSLLLPLDHKGGAYARSIGVAIEFCRLPICIWLPPLSFSSAAYPITESHLQRYSCKPTPHR